MLSVYFFFQAEDGIRDGHVTGVQTCALPIYVSETICESRLDSRNREDGIELERFLQRMFLPKTDPSGCFYRVVITDQSFVGQVPISEAFGSGKHIGDAQFAGRFFSTKLFKIIPKSDEVRSARSGGDLAGGLVILILPHMQATGDIEFLLTQF